MKHLSCDVLVIGGGATGTGLLRDLSMRGLKAILVERRDLAYGTTGRYHGLLHSGGRYVVKDPQAARECYEDNLILRRIMPHCIEDTGGYFVLTPWDDPAYAARFLDGCHTAGIPVEELRIAQMLAEEPLLNPSISRCFRVPDGAADSFLAAHANVESARMYDAAVFTYHEVVQLNRDGTTVTGALCHDLVHDEEVQISADLTINAAGAWAGKVAASAFISIQMIPGKGTMLAVNHRIVHTVINRCKLPSDGDILVPAHTVTVMGTTDIKVSDPDSFGIEPWELRLMLDEGEKLIPGFRTFRMLRAWAGVRPLFQETLTASQNRDVTRAFVLLDHAQRDGVDGLLTITSGKWTTFRKMAEVTADKACEKLGIQRECRTHLEPLPSPHQKEKSVTPSEPRHTHQLGARLAQVEQERDYGKLVCECELATLDDVQKTILQDDVYTLDDIRRDLRLGMGPCQGAFCTLRAAGILHTLRQSPIGDTNKAIRDFLEERWKGQLPILWGQQLRQARLNQYIYQDVLNVEKLPAVEKSKLAADKYSPNPPQSSPPEPDSPPKPHTPPYVVHHHRPSSRPDVLVIGAGLAGLMAGWCALRRNKKVHIITKGWGSLFWGSGCIDLLEDLPLDAFITANPQHPYALVGLDNVTRALEDLIGICEEAGYPLQGTPYSNWSLPTALGTVRQTCLAPATMTPGDTKQPAPMLIIGFSQFLDFFPALVAENLTTQSIPASALTIEPQSLTTHRLVSAMVLARAFDTPAFREEVVNHIRPRLGSTARIGFPAVLGIKDPLGVQRDLEERLGLPVFEIPGLPPSIAGIRLHNILCNEITRLGGRILSGMQVVGCEASSHRINCVITEAAARHVAHSADSYVLATGGILGGGIHIDDTGYAHDSAFHIPIPLPPDRATWLNHTFISSSPHPIYRAGLAISPSFQPVDAQGHIIFDHLYAIGGIIGSFDPIQEHSLEGVALTTGSLVGEQLP